MLDSGGVSDHDSAGIVRQSDANHLPRLHFNHGTQKLPRGAVSTQVGRSWPLIDVQAGDALIVEPDLIGRILCPP